jgi:hypothetical protein
MSPFFTRYGKTILAAVAAAIVAGQAAITDGVVTKDEWITIAVAALGAFGVFFAPAITRASGRPRSSSYSD